jgi:hypothetical protein
MKSPAELKVVLRRQWEDATRREARLLGEKGVWPVVVSIRVPSPKTLTSDLDAVKRHVVAWRQVRIGEVDWEAARYRATAVPVDIPVRWRLRRPSEWIEACADTAMRLEYETMATLIERTHPTFYSLFVRKRSLWREKALSEVVQAARLAMTLEPNCAAGKPLRLLSAGGIDTKFFERNRQLVTALLDARFDGEVSQIGLEAFLGAFTEGDNWLLVIDLDGSLLPFKKQRVRSSELRERMLPGTRLLIVENESCQHQLPPMPGTIAVLGSGIDLDWTEGAWLSAKHVAYWGDIDTWGLQLLARARKLIRHLDALMMTDDIFGRFAGSAVVEPVVAGSELPADLSASEQCLYRRLLNEPRGRLEQEFLPEDLSRATILQWANGCDRWKP